MPRMILRIMTATMVICMVCLSPTQTTAESLNGLKSDPIYDNKVDENISLTCPMPITISCEANGIYQTFAEFEAAGGSVVLPDGCEMDSIELTFVVDILISQNGCNFVYMREYLLTADCDNTFTCNQLVMQTDNDNPVFPMCAPNISLPMDNTGGTCLVAYTVPDVVAIDGCDTDVMVTNDSPGNFPVGVTIVTYTATDNCGNEAECSFTVTVTDNSDLDVSCATDIVVNDVCDISEVPPYVDFAAFMAAGGSVSGNCSTMGGTFTISKDSTSTALSTCPLTYNRFYTITDGMNSGTCTQMITISDENEPTFTSPASITVDCSMTQDTSITGVPSNIMDNCDTSPSITWFDKDTIQLSMACTGEISFTRSWIVTDNCMNADTMDQIISTIDTIAPTALCLDTIVLYLDNLGFAYFDADTLDNGSTDNCSELSFSTDPVMTFVGCNQAADTASVNLIVTDGCNNTSSCLVSVVVLDTMGIILTSPTNDTVTMATFPDTLETIDEYENAGGTVNENCTSNYSLNVIDTDTIAICQLEIIRTYEYTDFSGNSDTATHTIIVTDGTGLADNEAPVITNVFPQFVALKHIDCTFDTTFSLPTATDDYMIDTTFFSISTFVNDTAVVTFVAEDVCGNITDTTFNLILLDPTSPDILIDDITIMCDTMGAVPAYTSIQEFLTGPGAYVYDCRLDSISFMHMGDVMQPDGSIKRTYLIDDFTGNTGTEVQNITFIDSTVPEFTFCPASFSIDLIDPDTCVVFVDIPTPLYSDNCNGTLTLTHNSPFGIDTDNADGDYPVGDTEVSYFLEDETGLKDTCTFTITVNDNLAPAIGCPGDLNVDCSFANYIPATDSTSFVALGGNLTDGCGIMSVTSESTAVPSTTDQFMVTYTATDNNGNPSMCFHIVTVIDSIKPVLTCVGSVVVSAPTNSCDSLITIITPTATDNCGVIDTIYNDLTLSDNATMVYSGTTTITWYAIDAAGNMASCTYDIIVADGTGPVLGEPDTIDVMCIEMAAEVDTFLTLQDLVDAGGSAFDNCGIEFFQIISETNIGDSIVRREYEAIDSTGNSSTVFQTIIIDDTTAPTFDAPADITIDCSISLDSLEVLGTVDSSLFMDNCGELDTLIYSDSIFSTGGCLANDSILRIWILTDDSGNESRDSQYITKIDTTGPVFDMSLISIADISCSDDLPATQILTATDNCSGAIVSIDTIPPLNPLSFCINYEIKYRYTATDNCGNTTQDSVSFMKLADTTAPVLVDSMNQVLDSSLDTCGVLVANVPIPLFTDDCSDTIIMTSNYGFDLYPLGKTNVIWSAQNNCGLTSTVVQSITIEDNVPPVIVCQDLNISLGGDGFAVVQADTLAKSITDNCDHYFGNSTKVRRLDGPTDCTNDGTFSNSVTFCCGDVGQTIIVEVQVTDDSGNINTCTSEVTVNNAQGINLIQGLPNINISCEFQFDPEDLSIFGSYVTAIEDQEDIRIEDHFYQFDSIAGQDGLYINTCGLTSLSETSEELLGSCGRDTIIRHFKFKNGDDSLTINQYIYRHDVNPFLGTDIEWPAHFVWNQCANPAPDTSISGAPIIMNNDYCSQVAVSFKDQLFNYPLTSCPVVKRKWKIIDWCQYDNSNGPDNNPGLWTYNQFINVENDVPPTITSICNDTLICAPGNACEATVNLSITAEDDCMADAQNLYYKYRIDIGNDNNNANDITGTSSSFSHQVEAGIHKVKWFVEDRCGNVNQDCEYLITVKECKDPTPVCHDGLAIDLAGNQSVELWASDINQSSSDNCTPNSQLSFSFSSDPTNNLITFTCADLGDNEVDMWVTDLAGNQSYCTATINIQDNLDGCSNPIPNIQGKIATENNVAIPEAMVSILGAEMDNEVMTEKDGVYAFGDLDMQNDYQIQVDRDKHYLEGVTTLDLVMIQRHILGLSELDSPYKLIAADINNSESLTAVDLLALRKLILGVDLTFDDNTSWRFVSKNESMNDMTDPWPFTEDLILQSESTQDIDADFVGVKIGDVNNSAEGFLSSEIIEKRSSNTLGIITHDRKIRRDDQVYIDLISSSSVDLEAMQMTITWDSESMSLIDIVPIGLDMEDYHSSLINPGQLTIAWHNVEGKKVIEGVPFFQLVMEGNKTTRLSSILNINSDITSAIAYNTDDESMDVNLRFEDVETFDIIFGQNKPNPFLSETTVEFNLPETMEVTFKVFDGNGKLIHKATNDYNEGSNTLKLGEQLGEYRGILYLKIETAEFSEVKRMIRIE